MKKVSHYSFAIIILILVLTISACDDAQQTFGYGSIAVELDSGFSKSIRPSFDSLVFDSYRLVGECISSEVDSINKEFKGNSIRINGIVNGEWIFYVEGFNADGILIGRSATHPVSIKRDKITREVYYLDYVAGEGNLLLSITTQTSKVHTITCMLEKEGSEPLLLTMTKDDSTSENGVYIFEKTFHLPNGEYSGTITMMNDSEQSIGFTTHPAIWIFSCLTSEYSFSWEKFQRFLPAVDTPIPSVEPGRCYYNTEVSFSTIEEGTKIYYSVTEIDSDYQEYTSPIPIVDDSTIYVFSEKLNLEKSEIADYSYVCKVKSPEVSLASGEYLVTSLTGITISDTDENAAFYYTVDGTDPCTSNTRIQYSSDTPLSFTSSTTLKIVAVEEGYAPSDVLEVSYIARVPSPTSSLTNCTIIEDTDLSFNTYAGSSVYYTTDGSNPSSNSTLYTQPITITDSCVVKAISVIDGCKNSDVVSIEFVYDDVYSVTNDGKISPINKNNLPSVVIIPRSIHGVTVTSISEMAFAGCTGITSITIPNSVTSIGDSAFGGCYHLTGISIPNTVTSIGNYAFSGCEMLSNITIPDSVTRIGQGQFSSCISLTSIIIPYSVTSIGESAFIGCSGLTNITISSSVTSIGDSAFSYCTGLTSITIPNSVTSIGTSAFYVCTGLTSIVYDGTQVEWLAIEGVSSLSDEIMQLVTFKGYEIGSRGPAGGFIFYDCDADNDSGNQDGLISSECGWRYLEAAPENVFVDDPSDWDKGLRILNYQTKDSVGIVFGIVLNSNNKALFVNNSLTYNESDCTSTAIGTGKRNTDLLVDFFGDTVRWDYSYDTLATHYAAKECKDYSYGGYDDWFLPSKDELSLMYTNLKSNSIGDFNTEDCALYYSSSESTKYSEASAWYINFTNGQAGDLTSTARYCVRAVRSFL